MGRTNDIQQEAWRIQYAMLGRSLESNDRPMRGYKIVDNFLEASGQSIIFGGGSASLTPTDIEIRHNHLYKPMIWKESSPGFVAGKSGHPFIVKNLFELKNAQRLLFEGCLIGLWNY